MSTWVLINKFSARNKQINTALFRHQTPFVSVFAKVGTEVEVGSCLALHVHSPFNIKLAHTEQ